MIATALKRVALPALEKNCLDRNASIGAGRL
jgi:hypothetical protein